MIINNKALIELRTGLATMIAEVEDLKALMDSANKFHDDLEAEIDAKMAKVQQLRKRRDAYNNAVLEYDNKITEYENTIEDFKLIIDANFDNGGVAVESKK